MKTIVLEHEKTKCFFNDRYVWLLLIISLSVRIYLSFFTYVIKNDSVAFIQNAKYFASGDFSSGLGHDYHPLYSLIMAALYKVVPNMELSGTIVSVFFGTLTVIVFYLIGKNVFDRKISFVSSIILAFHPYAVRFSADIISESTYFFFFISALGSGYFAITNRKLLLFVLTGICSALAYLARPEGIGIIIIVASWCALKDCVNIKVLWKEKLVSILVLVISFLVFSMPYLVYIKKETGNWRLTKKKNVSHMAGVEERFHGQNSDILAVKDDAKRGNSSRDNIKQVAARRTNFQIHINSILHMTKKYISSFHPFLFMFFIFGVINWSRIRKRNLFGFYIITVIAFYFFILHRLSITYLASNDDVFMYPSRRHLMPLVIPAIFCVGLGVYTAGAWIHGKFHNCNLIVGFKELLKGSWIVQLIVLTIVVSVLLPKTLKPQRLDKLGIKKAGQWVSEHSRKPLPVILGMSPRSAYYAGGKHIQMENIDETLVLVRAKNVDFILITQKEYRAIEEELLSSIKSGKIALAYKYPEKEPLGRHSILLYKALY
jgi:4-amino-4-deoxy-L-arabinose transferase-like glycosyltransferase